MMLAPQQLFGRGIRPRRAFASPLRSNGSGRQPLYIESPVTNSIWPVRQRRLAEHMPGLFQKMRESGNNIMNPLDLVPCQNLDDYVENPFVLDLLMNGIARPYQAMLFGFPSPTGGMDINDYFTQLYAAGTQVPSFNIIDEILKLFQRLSEILRNDFGCGFGDGIYTAIMNWAARFIPLLGLRPGATYELIEHLYTMTDKDEATLWRLLAMLPFQSLAEVLSEAQQRAITEMSYLSINIGRVYIGLPSILPR